MVNRIKNLCVKDPNRLLELLHISGISNITRVIKSYGIEIQMVDIKSVDKNNINSVGNLMGTIHINNSFFKKDKKMIIVDNLPSSTTRFVTAYLFSGYQLNGSNNKEYLDGIYYESIYDRKVYNYTLDLLIPDSIFNCDYEQIKDISLLANKYQVSEFLIIEKLKRKEKKSNLRLL